MKVKIPRKVKIGAYDYTIKFVPNLVYDHKLLGQSLSDKQEIRIEPKTTKQTNAVTLWHEIIHAINGVYSCEIDESNTDRIAQGIAAILQSDFGIEFDWSNIKEN